jgi:HEAT repeat protein
MRSAAPRDRATEALERFLAARPGERHQHVAAIRAAARVAGPGPLVARLRRIARRGADAGAVIEAAYVLDGPEGTAYLGELARDPRTGPEAVHALARLGTRAAVTALVRCAADEPSEGAVRALREAREIAREVLLADLESRDDATRLHALALLARLHAREVVPAADREARRARDPVPALRALARLGTTEAFETLLSLGGALGKEATVAQVIRAVPEAAVPALQELIRGRNREVAVRAVGVLAGIEHPSAIATMEELLDDRSGLAPALVRALAHVQGPEATELLHEARARPGLRWEAELALRERAGRNL